MFLFCWFRYFQNWICMIIQVPRILAPIVKCIDRLPALTGDPAFHKYVSEEWGSIHGLRMQILSDFFKHGFDGSGILNFIRNDSYFISHYYSFCFCNLILSILKKIQIFILFLSLISVLPNNSYKLRIIVVPCKTLTTLLFFYCYHFLTLISCSLITLNFQF